jgi:rod shape-determining protein MreD
MRQGQQLLLPANPLFIWGSLVGAFLLNLLLNIAVWGRAAWAPDFLAISLVFWGVHQPQRVGMGAAFVFGLLMDVHQGSVLGQHALAYSVLSFLAISIHRRLLWFTVPSQSLQVLPLMGAAHVVEMTVRLMVGGNAPSWLIVFAPLAEALLWPLATIVLLMPQRRAPDPDVDRPL